MNEKQYKLKVKKPKESFNSVGTGTLEKVLNGAKFYISNGYTIKIINVGESNVSR